MKAALFALGTRGDVEPFLAVGEIVSSRGWDVVCIFPEQFRADAEAMGFRFYGFDKEFLGLLQNRDAKRILGGGGSRARRLKSWWYLARSGMKLTKASNELQRDVLLAEAPDRVIYHPKCLLPFLWSTANPGKAVMLSPIPGILHPVDGMTPLFGDRGPALNRMAFRLINSIKAIAIRSFAKKFRNTFPGIDLRLSAILRTMLESEKALYTVSPSLFPKPDYWPDQAKVVGYFERDKTVAWAPDAGLLEFLDKYSCPILISFGSMTNPEPRAKSRIIVDVLRELGIPAIINTSWGGLEKIDDAPEHVHFVDHVPYDWLFPRISAVVHHGGSGTTHMGLKHGCPSLLIPHAVDQFLWDRVISAKRLGPKGISMRDLNETDFRSKLIELTRSSEYKENALKIAAAMKCEADADRLFDMIRDV